MRIGMFSVSWYPLWKITIRFTWNSMLNCACMNVVQQKIFGKSMYMGISRSGMTLPSAIWMFCTSVADTLPSNVSTRTSWISIDLIWISEL